jgi:hypothetical protein
MQVRRTHGLRVFRTGLKDDRDDFFAAAWTCLRMVTMTAAAATRKLTARRSTAARSANHRQVLDGSDKYCAGRKAGE